MYAYRSKNFFSQYVLHLIIVICRSKYSYVATTIKIQLLIEIKTVTLLFLFILYPAVKRKKKIL